MGKVSKRYVYDEFTAAGDLSGHMGKLFALCIYWVGIVFGSFAVAELFSIMGESTMAESITRIIISVLNPVWTPVVVSAGSLMFAIFTLRMVLRYGSSRRKWGLVFPSAWIVFGTCVLLVLVSIIFFGFGVYGLWFPDTAFGSSIMDAYRFLLLPFTNFPWNALPDFSFFEVAFLVVAVTTSLGLLVYGAILFIVLLSSSRDVIFKYRLEESAILR